jgi:hypothetical protein
VDIIVYSTGTTLPLFFLDFLKQLATEGIRHKLICRHGPLAAEVVDHVRRHKNISLVLIDSMKNWRVEKDDRKPWRNLGRTVAELSVK